MYEAGTGGSLVTSTHPPPSHAVLLAAPRRDECFLPQSLSYFPSSRDAIPFLSSFLGPGLSKVNPLRTPLKQVLPPGYQPSDKDGD